MSIITLKDLLDDDEFEAKVAKAKADIARDLAKRKCANSIHEKIAAEVPQLRRGTVWCYTCGREERVDSAASLKHGWPKCCGSTMSIDSPEERQQRATLRALEAQEAGR